MHHLINKTTSLAGIRVRLHEAGVVVEGKHDAKLES